LQYFYATIVAWLYEHDAASIATAFNLLLPGSVVTYHAGSATRTDVVTVVTPQFSIAVSDGTATFQQIAMQAFLAIQRPTNIGVFGTFPFWNDNADWIHGHLMADGANPVGPVFLVGHSYGGVSASILAARYRAFQPDRQIRCLTFGSPKPGDERLRAALSRVEMLSLANTGDIITSLAPELLILEPVASALGIPLLRVWADWIREPSRMLQHASGRLEPSGELWIDYVTMLALANNALFNTQPGPVLSHPITEYRRRINERCPVTEWPVSPTLYAFLQTFSPFENFVSPGAGSWTCPLLVTTAKIETWGAGSFGGPHISFNGGVGGGGGAYARDTIAVVPGTVYPLFVGDGSLFSPVSNGQSSFNGGVVLADCAGHGHPSGLFAPGLASRSVGSVKFNGGFGGQPQIGFGGGGGSSAGPASAGFPSATSIFQPGGIAPPGGGDGGDGGITSPGLRGKQPGGGGGGQQPGGGPIAGYGGNGKITISW